MSDFDPMPIIWSLKLPLREYIDRQVRAGESFCFVFSEKLQEGEQ